MNTIHSHTTLAQTLLQQLAADCGARQRLCAFARNRLATSGADRLVSDGDAEDVVHDALLRVLRHLAKESQGWQPKPMHVADAAAFERWVCSIINAVVANKALAARTRRQRELLAHPAAAPDVVAQVEARCKRDRLIEWLRLHYQDDPAWLERIELWAREASGCYPGKPHQAYALRQQVERWLTENAPELE